jgi:hypothetical protein
MKCFFTIDPLRGNKVLIPYCYGSLHQEDLSCCTCSDHPMTYAQFEKALYNEKISELNKEIEELKFLADTMKKDNYQLIRIIEKLTNKKL